MSRTPRTTPSTIVAACGSTARIAASSQAFSELRHRQVWLPVLDDVPRFLFLDEPVASLDIRHQLIIMRIAREFADAGGGVISILHDLNLTAMFADRVAVVHRGQVAAAGGPRATLTDDLMERVFECPLRVGAIPPAGTMFVLPQSAWAAERQRAHAPVSRDPSQVRAHV